MTLWYNNVKIKVAIFFAAKINTDKYIFVFVVCESADLYHIESRVGEKSVTCDLQ